MRKDIRREILDAAKRLFTEYGYNAVSTQQIADALGISKGNLNYHFARKEDIFVAIVEDMHSHYSPPEVSTNLHELDAFFIRVKTVVENNAFYFWHYAQFSQISGRIRDIQSKVIEDRYEALSRSFAALNRGGLIRGEEYEGEYGLIIENLSLTLIFWTPHSKLRTVAPEGADLMRGAWAAVYPLLTEAGKREYTEICGGGYE